jgi:hypothetical protein
MCVISLAYPAILITNLCSFSKLSVADCLEKQLARVKCDPLLSTNLSEGRATGSSSEETLLVLSHNVASLLDQLEDEVYSASLSTTNWRWQSTPVLTCEGEAHG